jgi:hypothetical protein
MKTRAVLFATFLVAAGACAQTAVKPIEPNGRAASPNALKAYLALRTDLPGAESVTVKDFTLAREGAAFHFDQGVFYLYSPVEGRVTGAVFMGTGQFKMTPKDAGEQHSLALRPRATR